MAVSILVDASRSRALERTAKKYNSQALEADALHFRTDIWSSSVVIVGFAAVKIADWFPNLGWLRAGDALAALGVSAIVVWVCLQLGRRTSMLLSTKLRRAWNSGLPTPCCRSPECRIATTFAFVPQVPACSSIFTW
jgi:divalent metal cation (Fe/Co/Zn/Cd) transporter